MAASSALPKYVQVSEMLIRDIAAGHLAGGVRLPPEREMAVELGISVGTLRKALLDLTEKGLLERVQGSGNYVRNKPDVNSVYTLFRLEKTKGGGLPTAEVLSVDRLGKPKDAPDFGPDNEAHRIRRLRYLDGDLIALEEIWLDGSVRDTIARKDLSDSLYQFYRADLGITIAQVEDRIGVAGLPRWTPEQFHLRRGVPIGYIERVSWTADALPLEFSRTWFDNNKARYVSRMGKG
jgi:GntR family transcriptional regulator